MTTFRLRLENLTFTVGAALAVATAILISTDGFAQSHPARRERDPVDHLVYQAQDLQYAAQQARLHYPILSAVDQLEHTSRVLDHCVTYGDPDRRGRWGRSDACRSELRSVRFEFRAVQNHLAQIHYHYPQVYRQFLDVQQALERVENWFGYQPQPQPQPLPPPPPPAYPVPPAPVPSPHWLRATGSMEHISFDLRGDRIQIQHQCHEISARAGLVWVRSVFTNGRSFHDPYGRAFHINDACRFVAQSAH